MFLTRASSLAVFAVFTVLMGCGQKSDSPVVARVGKSVLTLDDLNSSIPPQYRGQISREQHIAYVKQWIDSELLYQEALRRRIHKDKTIRKRLERMKRDLLCAEVVSRGSRLSRSAEIPGGAVQEYYEKNQEQFRRRSDAVKYVEVVLEDAATAHKVRGMITAKNLHDIAVRFSRFPVAEPESAPFVPIDQFPSEIAGILGRTRIGRTSAPVETEEGFSLFRILDRKKKGTISSLEEVREDIVGHLTSRAQKAEIDRLMVELRRSMDVEYNLGVIPEESDEGAVVSDEGSLAESKP